MHRTIPLALFVGFCAALPGVARAEPMELMTSTTGGGQPFTNRQPSLALTEFVQFQGVYPSRNGAAASASFMGQVRLFAGNFSPGGFPRADGQVLPIAQNDALFTLLGTFYGGDGRTTFALPDLRGRAVVHKGTGPGLQPWPLGRKMGVDSLGLTNNELPSHLHSVPVPEPSSLALVATGLAIVVLGRRRHGTRRRKN